MIPQNVLSTRPVQSRFKPPSNIVTLRLTEAWERGGIALQNTTQGLNYQNWFCKWHPEDNTVYLTPDNTGVPIAIFTETNVFEVSFAFDQNMRYAVGTLLTDGTFKFRWYDTAANNYVITTIPAVTGFKLTLDDKRDVQVGIGASDVILTYLQDTTLFFRAQRERYEVEHQLANQLPLNLMITNFGMNEVMRLQWRMRFRINEERLPWRP